MHFQKLEIFIENLAKKDVRCLQLQLSQLQEEFESQVKKSEACKILSQEARLAVQSLEKDNETLRNQILQLENEKRKLENLVNDTRKLKSPADLVPEKGSQKGSSDPARSWKSYSY